MSFQALHGESSLPQNHERGLPFGASPLHATFPLVDLDGQMGLALLSHPYSILNVYNGFHGQCNFND